MERAASSKSGFVGLWLRSPGGLFAGECRGGKERSAVAIARNGIISTQLYEELLINMCGLEHQNII